MSICSEFMKPRADRQPRRARSASLLQEMRKVWDDLGTVLLGGLCIAGLVIAASIFDGDLQGSNEVVAAILGTLCLFAVLAALELADRLKGRKYVRED